MIDDMSETPEHPTTPTPAATATAPPPRPVDDRPSRLVLIALWVAIVAGVVFTVAVIFFSGFALGRHSGGGFHHEGGGRGHEHSMSFHRPIAPMGPWQQSPGYGPGGGGPGGATTTPAVPSPSATPHP
ncbi:MAG: hypothetical protein JO152_15480 [Mycobacteriaceae bacterium]|nr:hypothetical protein [Mycobacteriaceae bacterium]